MAKDAKSAAKVAVGASATELPGETDTSKAATNAESASVAIDSSASAADLAMSLSDTSAAETVKTIMPVEDVTLIAGATLCSVKYSVTYAGKKYSGIKEIHLTNDQFDLMLKQAELAPDAKEPTSDTREYLVNYVVNHNGDDYAVGDPIHLTDKQAEPLLSVGAISEQDQDVAEGDA